ncbi:MAG: flagellar hook-associated protein FlgK [Betaproteobacteria bacterium]|nr:flagellar hook-associated protein FlgK [Betaproteobacteria bacterium]
MSSGLFGIGISGLTAAQAGLVTTGHNIANASTAGFHRQQVVQSNATPLMTGNGFIGTGVNVETVRRVYSDFLDGQANRAQSQASYYAAYNSQVAQIDNLLSDPSAGLAPQLQTFFSSVHEVASNPASASSRQAMISSANTLAARFQSLDNRLVEINRGVNAQIDSTISSVNAYAREIASLNARISATGASPDNQPNDLLDKRDQLIGELNSMVGATAVTQPDGNVSVSIGSGQALVVGTQAYSLAAVPSAEVPDQTDVVYRTGGTSVLMTPSTLSAGSLGALLSFRSTTLADTQNQLGRIAAGLTETFNAQHRLGQDLQGGLGGDFFQPMQGTVTGNAGNAGTATITAGLASASALTSSNYRLVFTGGAYQLTRLSDNTMTSYATLPQTVDGISIQLSGGAPANGDSFFIEPTRYTARNLTVAVTNPNAIAAAAPMRTASASANTGAARIDDGIVNGPLNANVQQPVSIVFTSPTTFNVTGTGTGNPVGVAYTSGGSITYNGWTVKITGTPATGDTFNVTSNSNGTADSRNAARLADLQLANTLNNGTTSYQGAYGQLTSSVGNTGREMQIASDAQDTIAVRARESQQSLSGVNLDEEAANLLRYQQAYQASSKVIEVASTLFDTILRLGA